MPLAAVLPTALGVVGTAVSAVGQSKAGTAAQATAEFNAQQSEQNARNAQESAAVSEQQQRYQDRKVLAADIANTGASGVQITGSPLEVMAENARQAELNALIIRRGGQLQAQSDLAQAAAERAAGAQEKTASDINVAGTLLTGAATTISNVNKLKKPKPAPINNLNYIANNPLPLTR